MLKPELWYPIKNSTITQGFGERPNYYRSHVVDEDGEPLINSHNGLDFKLNDTKLGYFAHNGTVNQFYEDKLGGIGVVIISDDAYDYAGIKVHMKTIYWHLDNANTFHVGQHVTTNDTYLCDNTGLTEGPHLHFGLKFCVWRDESVWQNINYENGFLGAVDPMPFFNGYAAEDATKIMDNLKQQLTIYQKVVGFLMSLYKK